MTDTLLTIALSKERILEETLPLLAAAGIAPTKEPERSHKLIIGTNHDNTRLVIVYATDVPTYVQYGAADFSVAGKNVLIEHGGDGLYRPLDLHIVSYRVMVAIKKGFDCAAASRSGSRLRIATKYPDIAAEHFIGKGVYVDIIKLYGSMGLTLLASLSGTIIDLIPSGNTLKVSGLGAVEHVADISSRLVVNKAALKAKYALLNPIIQASESAAKAV